MPSGLTAQPFTAAGVAGEGANEGFGFPQPAVAVDPRAGAGAAAPLPLGAETVGEGRVGPLEPVVELLPEQVGLPGEHMRLASKAREKAPSVARSGFSFLQQS